MMSELEGRWRVGVSCGGRSAVFRRRSTRTKTGGLGEGTKMQKGRRWGECATREWDVVGAEGEA